MRSLQSELKRVGLINRRVKEVDQKNTKTTSKPQERLTDRELRELMGVGRDTYKRVGGAIRRR